MTDLATILAPVAVAIGCALAGAALASPRFRVWLASGAGLMAGVALGLLLRRSPKDGKGRLSTDIPRPPGPTPTPEPTPTPDWTNGLDDLPQGIRADTLDHDDGAGDSPDERRAKRINDHLTEHGF